MRSTQLLLLITINMLIASCSSTYQALNDSTQKRLTDNLINGNAHLDCNISCQMTWLNAKPRIKALHDNKQWNQLALQTQKIGYSNNLSWYYLGRAAEGLGARDAAKSYFKTSVESTLSGRACIKCNGINFPQDASQRLTSLESAPSTTIEPLPRNYPLFVNVDPSNTVIKIMNIQPKFSQGIQLTPGKYHLKLQKPGYQTINKTIKVRDSAVTISFKMVPVEIEKSNEKVLTVEYKSQNTQSSTESGNTYILSEMPQSKTKATVIKNADLKAQPTLFSDIKGKLHRGEKVEILENLGDWVKVQTKQGVGYVYRDLLR